MTMIFADFTCSVSERKRIQIGEQEESFVMISSSCVACVAFVVGG